MYSPDRRVTSFHLLRGVDSNHRPLGYEPSELPDCSTPLYFNFSLPCPDFQYFSLALASRLPEHSSIFNTPTIFLPLVDFVFPFLCSCILRLKSFVIPTYNFPLSNCNAYTVYIRLLPTVRQMSQASPPTAGKPSSAGELPVYPTGRTCPPWRNCSTPLYLFSSIVHSFSCYSNCG